MISRIVSSLGMGIVLLAAPAAAQEAEQEPTGDGGPAPAQAEAPPPGEGPPAAPETPAEPPTAKPAEDTGPEIDLPEEVKAAPQPDEGVGARDVDLTRGLQQARFARAKKTAVGGYGELHFNWAHEDGSDGNSATIDLHRLVLFFAHNFNQDFRFYSEVELEHGFVVDNTEGASAPGKVAIEQAYIDWKVGGDAIGLRAGVILVPMGIINQWHEPPIFHGVERPMVDKVVIPTTWSEGGVGVFGEPVEGLRYELYLTGGLDASRFSQSSGLRGGRLGVGKALAKSPAITGRVEYEPALGVVVGTSGYFNLAGANAELGGDTSAAVGGVSADVRGRWKGLEARGVVAYFHVGDTDGLRQDADPSSPGTQPISDVGSDILGMYGEVAYDVLYLADVEHQLLPFARLEWYDTTLSEQDPAFDGPSFTDLVFGLSYRPIPQVAFKGNVIRRLASSGGTDETRIDLGVGWMF